MVRDVPAPAGRARRDSETGNQQTRLGQTARLRPRSLFVPPCGFADRESFSPALVQHAGSFPTPNVRPAGAPPGTPAQLGSTVPREPPAPAPLPVRRFHRPVPPVARAAEGRQPGG